MHIRVCSFVLLLFSVSATIAADEFPGKKTDWQGFNRYDFTVDGRRCWVVTPKSAAEGQPWIWRARFFGHEPQADVALLGVHDYPLEHR